MVHIFNEPDSYWDVVGGKVAVRSLLDRSMTYHVFNAVWNKLFQKKIIDDKQIFFPDNCCADDMGFLLMALPEMKRCVLL